MKTIQSVQTIRLLEKATYFLMLFLAISLSTQSQDKTDLLILRGETDKAMQLIDRQIADQPSADLFYKKGIILSGKQQYQDAVTAFKSALNIDPDHTGSLTELAECLAIIGNNTDASVYLEKAVRLNPADLVLAGKLGRNYITTKEFKKAYKVFENICSVDSSNIYWNRQFAFSAFHSGKPAQAISLYEKVVMANPRDYTSWFNLIRLYSGKENDSMTVQTINRGLQHFPRDAGFYEELASFFFGKRNYQNAGEAYDQYFSAGGDSIYKHLMNYGICLYFTGNERNAVSLLEICASQVVNDPYVLFYLSLCHKKMNQMELAEGFMHAAIEAATPAYLPDMYHHLGQILGLQRKFEESVLALKKANELDPANAEVLFEIATTYEEFNNNKTLALNYYRIYLKEAGESAKNATYALTRISKIREDLFFEE